jgi:phage terminase Nu1 subunit (DNA packaging protein)
MGNKKTLEPAATGPASLSAFARAEGWALPSVRLAIRMGRLTSASVQRDLRGRWMILDAEKARAEWAAHTRPRVKANGAATPAPSDLAAATLRERLARAEAFELQTARKKRELVPAAEVETRWAGMVLQARTTLLGLPTRARQRLPHLGAADLVVLEGLVREVLEELAAGAPA